MWILESWWSWKINMSTELFWNCFFVHFFQYYKCLLYQGHLYWSVFRAGKYWVEIFLFCSRHFIGWRKNVEIYCFRFASWLINFAWVTNYMPPYTYPPRVETLCIGIISVLIQVMCYSQMPLSIGTQLSFWHLFDKFLIRFETGQSDFQNKCEHVIRNIACLFVKFQSWKWTGVCKNAHKSVLVINKFFSCPNFGKI